MNCFIQVFNSVLVVIANNFIISEEELPPRLLGIGDCLIYTALIRIPPYFI